jgi:hypothetical protein
MTSYQTSAIRIASPELTKTSLAPMRQSKAERTTPYASLLRGPTSMLVSVVSERADVSFAAILGYN